MESASNCCAGAGGSPPVGPPRPTDRGGGPSGGWLGRAASGLTSLAGGLLGLQPATASAGTGACAGCEDAVITAVAHELRTPMTSLRSMLEILRDHPDISDEERALFLAALLDETARLEQSVERMLNASTVHPDRWCVEAAHFLAPAPLAEAPAVDRAG